MGDLLTFQPRRSPVAVPDPTMPDTPRQAIAQIFPTVTLGSIDYFLIKLWALGFKVVRAEE